MTVVAIIAVLSTLAWSSFRSDARPGDVASSTANLIREAARKAVAGGTVRADVVAALSSRARARIHVFTAGGAQYVTVERLIERALPSNQADWVEVMRQKIPRGNTIAGWRQAADLNGGLGPAEPIPATGAQIYCEPDGRCGAATLYYQDTNGPRRARAVMMPLGGSPAIFDAW